MRGYDYDRGYRPLPPIPPPEIGWLPGSYLGQRPEDGWGWWGGPLDWPPYPRVAGNRYDAGWRPEWMPSDPRRRGTYGRRGDVEVRRWAERYGYDMETSWRPRPYGRWRGG